MSSAAADDAAWAAQIGPALSEAGVARLLGRSVDDVRGDPDLLRLPQREGGRVYPVVQFGEDGAPVAGVAAVLMVLAAVVGTPWTAASWLTSANRRLNGARPIDALRRGEVAAVLSLAQQAAADLQH